MKKTNWTARDITDFDTLPDFEFKDNKGEYQHFQFIYTKGFIIFGSSTNNIFLQSGYIKRGLDESLLITLGECLLDLETYYNDGKQYTTRIVCNERM